MFLLVWCYSLAGVREVYVYVASVLRGDDGEGSVAAHGVDGVLADIFDDPFEEVAVEWRRHGLVGYVDGEEYFARASPLHVFQR